MSLRYNVVEVNTKMFAIQIEIIHLSECAKIGVATRLENIQNIPSNWETLAKSCMVVTALNG